MRTDRRRDFPEIAYEGHFALCQHYSLVVMRARVAIITLAVLAVSAAFGVFPGIQGREEIFRGITSRSFLAYTAAVLLALVHWMEVGYLKRLYQVVANGRQLEQREGLSAFFTSYTRPDSLPIHAAYTIAIFVLVLAFFPPALNRQPMFNIGLVVLVAIPLGLSLAATWKLQQAARALLTRQHVIPRYGDDRPETIVNP